MVEVILRRAPIFCARVWHDGTPLSWQRLALRATRLSQPAATWAADALATKAMDDAVPRADLRRFIDGIRDWRNSMEAPSAPSKTTDQA